MAAKRCTSFINPCSTNLPKPRTIFQFVGAVPCPLAVTAFVSSPLLLVVDKTFVLGSDCGDIRSECSAKAGNIINAPDPLRCVQLKRLTVEHSWRDNKLGVFLH